MSSLWGRMWEDLRYTYSAEAEAKSGDGLRSRMAGLSQLLGLFSLVGVLGIFISREGWAFVPGCLLVLAGAGTSVMVTKHLHHVATEPDNRN